MQPMLLLNNRVGKAESLQKERIFSAGNIDSLGLK